MLKSSNCSQSERHIGLEQVEGGLPQVLNSLTTYLCFEAIRHHVEGVYMQRINPLGAEDCRAVVAGLVKRYGQAFTSLGRSINEMLAERDPLATLWAIRGELEWILSRTEGL